MIYFLTTPYRTSTKKFLKIYWRFDNFKESEINLQIISDALYNQFNLYEEKQDECKNEFM